MTTKIVLIGAGSAQFGYGTLGDIFQSKTLAGSEIVLHDINPKALALTEDTARRFIAEKDLPFTISATTNRKEALKDVKEFSSALETVGSAKDQCFDCYIDSLEKIYDNYDAAKKLNEDDRLSILMDCAIQYIHFD